MLLFSCLYPSQQALVCLPAIHPITPLLRIFETNFRATSHFYKTITKNLTFVHKIVQYQLPAPFHQFFNLSKSYQYISKFMLILCAHSGFGILLNSCIIFRTHYFKRLTTHIYFCFEVMIVSSHKFISIIQLWV